MTVFRLDHRMVFPPPELADESGLLAVGGDLSAERLRLAYGMGIFPWYDEDMPILWHSPDPRMILLPSELCINRSLRKAMRRAPYRITLDTAFHEVITACSQVPREGQGGTWITEDMITAYDELHRQGHAHSVEAWQGDELVGGLYGVALGSAFFGESMFALAASASKIAFATLVAQLVAWDFDVVDCQQHTDHLERFGAVEVPRTEFLARLEGSLKAPTRVGPWRFDTH
ncbi:MAG: leucyl/phenylalanyl-tRNA--protein transferase [Myxococcales bacterium]|nr:leucyl/phenylalanyl-tRNA--protein transferase [Myxococcales bacterium]